MPHTERQKSQSKVVLPNVPDGFAIGTAPDGQQYLVPQYMLPAAQHAFDSYVRKINLKTPNIPPQFDQASLRPKDIIAARISYPPDPQLTEQDYLDIHAEILALQHKLGISYKDASNRLYMAKFERLKAADEAYKAFATLDARIGTALETLAARFTAAEHASSAASSNDPRE